MLVPLKRPKAIDLAGYSALLEYPDEGYRRRAQDFRCTVEASCPRAGTLLEQFCQQIEKMPLSELEEVFTRTFDMAPICSPYISAHLYGDENYERGNLMAGLIDRYGETGFDYGKEMPDHLSVILRFIPFATAEEADELVEFCLKKPVAEMADGLRDSGNPYGTLLLSLVEVLNAGN
jgi:nitrate reductase delta subunit